MNKADDANILDIIGKDLIELLDLGDLPKEKQDEYRKLATETITNRTFSRITEILKEKGLIEDFEKAADTEKGVIDFMSKHGINFEEIAAEEAVIYKAQMKTINDALYTGVTIKAKD